MGEHLGVVEDGPAVLETRVVVVVINGSDEAVVEVSELVDDVVSRVLEDDDISGVDVSDVLEEYFSEVLEKNVASGSAVVEVDEVDSLEESALLEVLTADSEEPC